MKRQNILVSFLLLLFCLTMPVKAEDTINEIESFKEYDVQESYTEAGDEITLNKNVFGSSMLAGNIIKTTGIIDGGLFVAGNELSLNGSSEYAVAAGNTISFLGNVQKETVIAGRELTLDKSATFGRDTYLYGQKVILSGSFSRNVVIYAEEVMMNDAMITGNVKIICSKLVINDNVKIDGKLTYSNSDNNSISDKAVIGSFEQIDNNVKTLKFNLDGVLASLAGYVSLLVVFAVAALYCPKMFNNIETKDFNFTQILTLSGIGLLGVLLIPLGIIILFLLYIGVPLALILLSFYLVGLYMSNMFVGYYVGKYVWNKYIKNEHNILLEGLIGISLLYILSIIPVLGVISIIVSFTCGFGLIIDLLKK